MSRHELDGCGRGGFTLLELVFGLTFAVIAFAGVASLLQVGMGTGEATMAFSQLNAQGNRTLGGIANELAFADSGNLSPRDISPLSSSSLTYRRAINVSNDEVIWESTSRIERQASPTDPDDGADNDGNGLVDDGRIVLITNPGQSSERTRVLATGVPRFLQGEVENSLDDNENGLIDEPGLSFDFTNTTLHIRLTMQRRGPRGEVLTQTWETSVSPRN